MTMVTRGLGGVWAIAAALAVCLALQSRMARAQVQEELAPATDLPGTPMTAPPEIREPAEWRPPSRIGTAVLLGGGLGDFTGETAQGATGMAGAWGLRLVSGTRSILGGELAYVGGVNPLDATAASDDYLLATGAEGAVRLGIPVALRSGVVAPFAFGGIGWTRYNLVNDTPDRGDLSAADDHQIMVPVGVGLAAGYRGFLAEARGSYRQAFEDDLIGSDDMSTWAVSLNLGGEF